MMQGRIQCSTPAAAKPMLARGAVSTHTTSCRLAPLHPLSSVTASSFHKGEPQQHTIKGRTRRHVLSRIICAHVGIYADMTHHRPGVSEPNLGQVLVISTSKWEAMPCRRHHLQEAAS